MNKSPSKREWLPFVRLLAIGLGSSNRHGSPRHENGVADRIEFLTSDLLAAVPAQRRFDFILSNPPYVSEAEAQRLPREVKDHEPRAALVAGPRGTEVIERLVPQAAGRLPPPRVLVARRRD
jgi:release factor glutamine methyltransferase